MKNFQKKITKLFKINLKINQNVLKQKRKFNLTHLFGHIGNCRTGIGISFPQPCGSSSCASLTRKGCWPESRTAHTCKRTLETFQIRSREQNGVKALFIRFRESKKGSSSLFLKSRDVGSIGPRMEKARWSETHTQITWHCIIQSYLFHSCLRCRFI